MRAWTACVAASVMLTGCTFPRLSGWPVDPDYPSVYMRQRARPNPFLGARLFELRYPEVDGDQEGLLDKETEATFAEETAERWEEGRGGFTAMYASVLQQEAAKARIDVWPEIQAPFVVRPVVQSLFRAGGRPSQASLQLSLQLWITTPDGRVLDRVGFAESCYLGTFAVTWSKCYINLGELAAKTTAEYLKARVAGTTGARP